MNKIDKLPTRILALASIVQITTLINELAKKGQCDSLSCDASIKTLAESSNDVREVYTDLNDLTVGVNTLKNVLEQSITHKDILLYSLSLMKLEKAFMREDEMLKKVASGINDVKSSTYFDINHENSIEKLANLYKNTVANLQPRIYINGKKNNLQNKNVANHIRALLLAGLRSVSLWRGNGGNLMDLIFNKKKIIKQLKQIKS